MTTRASRRQKGSEKMDLGKLKQFRSWLISAGIVVLVTVWLASGQVGTGTPEEELQAQASVITSPASPQQSRVRVRTQSAEAIMRMKASGMAHRMPQPSPVFPSASTAPRCQTALSALIPLSTTSRDAVPSIATTRPTPQDACSSSSRNRLFLAIHARFSSSAATQA